MRRILLVLAALLLAVLAAAAFGANALLASSAVRTRLAAAVERATGHRTNLDEPGTLAVSRLWTLHPVLEARGVSLLNPPGFSRPALATVRHASATVALWPLLSRRVELQDVTLDGGDVMLERANGHGNWERAPAAPASAPPPGASPRSRWTVRATNRIRVADSVLAWNGAPPVQLAGGEYDPAIGTVTARLAANGMPFTVAGYLGAPDRDPVEVGLSGAGGLVLLAKGTPGGTLSVNAVIPDLQTLAPLAGRPLPPLHDVTLAATTGPGGTLSLHARAGESDDGGLHLDHADLAAPAPDQPMQLTAEGAVRNLPVSAAVNLPSPSAMLGGGSIPFQALLLADGGTVSAQGTMAGWSAAVPEATLSARIPDLRHAGALAGLALPNLAGLAADARIAPAPNGSGLLLRGLRVTSDAGDAGGDALIRWSPRPLLRGSLVSQALDLDAILAPLPPPAAAPLATPPASEPPPAAPRPLPFAALQAMDADLSLAAGTITWHGGAYRALQARILLQDGRLRLDPAHVVTPGGSVDARLLADAAATPPTAAVTLLAPGLDAAPLAAAFGVPGAATGTLDLDLDLRAAGATARAMAPTLDGHAGIALVNGDMENQLLLDVFGSALRAAGLPVEAGGRSRVRCLALRFDAAAGHVDVKTLALDASRLRLDGEGGMDLVNQTLDLHLRPTLRIGGTGVAVPVHLVGPFAAPRPALERGAISPGRLGLSILGGAAAQPDLCGPALAAARGNRPGTAPQ